MLTDHMIIREGPDLPNSDSEQIYQLTVIKRRHAAAFLVAFNVFDDAGEKGGR
jgi:hypothetical protein